MTATHEKPAKDAGKPDGRTVRVAIVGGGIAGLAAAWHISRCPGFTVDVYERSWRLGGKGASVRDSKGRILEHGLHVWLGFYENAFGMMRECYDEVRARRWGPKSAEHRLVHGSIDDAFFPEPNIGVADAESEKDWSVWSGYLPPAKGLPGDLLDDASNPFTLQSYLLRCFDLLKTLMVSVIGPANLATGQPSPDGRSAMDEAAELDFAPDATRSPAAFVKRMAELLTGSSLITMAMLLQAITIVERWVQQLNYSPQVPDSILELVEAVAAQTRKQLRDFLSVNPRLRQKTEIIDIVMTIAVGLFRDRILLEEKGLDAINHLDYREWLLRHGATRTSVDSRFIVGIYDLVFAYRGGDRKKPQLAAGVALRGALRMFFTYRGAMFWRMRSGMGEAVFAPLYRAMTVPKRLAKRPDDDRVDVPPVRFHFLHTLRSVAFDMKDPNRRVVTTLEFAVPGDRAEVDELGNNALDAYGCWPDNPKARFADLPDQDETTFKREYNEASGDGFDAVIFAMGIDDLRPLLEDALVDEKEHPPRPFFHAMPPKWARMRDEVATVATKSAQCWIDRSLDELGWARGPGIFTAMDFRFNTWADMTHTLTTEAHCRDHMGVVDEKLDRAGSVAYFCGVLPDRDIGRMRRTEEDKARAAGAAKASYSDLDAALRSKVGTDLTAQLRHEMRPAWPRAYSDNHLKRGLVVDDHAQANYRGSDRYTLSLPGSIDDRISPLDRSVLNMTIAGDWTACGLDAGCIEAAVMSGMLAAYAITGRPDPKSIIGYNHP